MRNTHVTKLLIPAAGAGTRLRPITYATPKEMVRLTDKPIVYFLLSEAYLAGIREVVMITHVDTPYTKDFFESSRAQPMLDEFPGLEVSFLETDKRGGDGQAILLGKEAMGSEPFAVTMGDLIPLPGKSLLAELVRVYEEKGPVISVEEIPREKTGQYGVIAPGKKFDNVYEVAGIVEKPAPDVAPSNLAMTGKYILEPEIFGYLEQLQGEEGELKLANALNLFAKDTSLYACACTSEHYDTGTKKDLIKAEIAFWLEHPELKDAARQIIRSFDLK